MAHVALIDLGWIYEETQGDLQTLSGSFHCEQQTEQNVLLYYQKALNTTKSDMVGLIHIGFILERGAGRVQHYQCKVLTKGALLLHTPPT